MRWILNRLNKRTASYSLANKRKNWVSFRSHVVFMKFRHTYVTKVTVGEINWMVDVRSQPDPMTCQPIKTSSIVQRKRKLFDFHLDSVIFLMTKKFRATLLFVTSFQGQFSVSCKFNICTRLARMRVEKTPLRLTVRMCYDSWIWKPNFKLWNSNKKMKIIRQNQWREPTDDIDFMPFQCLITFALNCNETKKNSTEA